ncbi:MAG: CDP-diacylglycerol--glycerol-3-phosphate 3-phosphatidyltransferase [Caulobacterales bacterium]|jgi:CDP-diacylglycerol--glycerol-3-phosphate 3-phosphatidyltransferase
MTTSTQADPASKPSNLPNALSIARLIAAPVVAGLIVWASTVAISQSLSLAATLYGIATAVFALAALTDLLDGRLARDLNAVTPLGTALDHAADKALVTASLVALAYAALPLNLVCAAIIILTRDVAMAGLREGFMASGRSIPVSTAGKLKTVVLMVAIGAAILLQSLSFSGVDVGLIELLSGLAHVGLWVATALAITSAAGYILAALKPSDSPSTL